MAKRNRKNPSTLVFWNDLREALRRCSPDAKALWAVHMLPAAAESAEYGVVVIGKHSSRREELGDLLCQEFGQSAKRTQAAVDELIAKGVAEVDDKGRVYSRRFVREEADRRAKAAAGKLGGQASGKARRAKQTPQQDVNKEASNTLNEGEAERTTSDVDGACILRASREAKAKQSASNTSSKGEHSSFFSLHASKEEDISSDEEIAPSGARASRRDSDQDAVQAVVDLWDQYAAEIPKWPRTRGMSASRRSAIRARLREHGLDGVRAALERAKASHFIRQTGMRGWNLGWLMNPTNFIKVIEGVYDGHEDSRPEAVSRMEVSARVIDRLRQQETRNG